MCTRTYVRATIFSQTAPGPVTLRQDSRRYSTQDKMRLEPSLGMSFTKEEIESAYKNCFWTQWSLLSYVDIILIILLILFVVIVKLKVFVIIPFAWPLDDRWRVFLMYVYSLLCMRKNCQIYRHYHHHHLKNRQILYSRRYFLLVNFCRCFVKFQQSN